MFTKLLELKVNRDGRCVPGSKTVAGKPLVFLGMAIALIWVHASARGAAPVDQSVFSKPDHWAFRPVHYPSVPQIDSPNQVQARNPIDHFIYRELENHGLQPAPPADRRTLIRRASFDLLGLPPTPKQVEEFVEDDSPDAYENLIDRLLASPRYGERWGRHWLDLVRYAESDGFRGDFYRPQAWRYRDYVIESFNEDKPYDRFVREQLAGDEIAPEEPDVMVATAYLRHGVYEWNQRDARTQWNDILNEVTDVTSEVFLGLSMACARCHDHKFDPIPQEDYFRMRAFFEPMLWRDDRWLATPKEKAEYKSELAKWREENAELLQELNRIEDAARERGAEAAIVKFPDDVEAMARKPRSERAPREVQLADMVYRQVLYEQEDRLNRHIANEDKERWEEIKEKLKNSGRPKPPPPQFTVSDVGAQAPPTYIPGKPDREPIPPGPPSVLDPAPIKVEPPAEIPQTTGRRLALARWLTDPDNPLSTRVIVNRIWQYHFGTGIVATTSDFGKLGEPPSHPELLDWLTTRFVENGWRFKDLHRLIMTSAAYRQSSRRPIPETARRLDPENRWLWRFPIQRLDADQVRDAMLYVSGELDPVMGGPSVSIDSPRRSVYTKVIRNDPYPLLKTFDRPDGFNCVAKRDVTTTPHQALLMMNSSWPLKRAKAFAERLASSRCNTGDEVVRKAYQLAFGRSPTEDEIHRANAFLERQTQRIQKNTGPDSVQPDHEATASEAYRQALVDFAHLMFNANEFLYVE